MKKIFLLFLLLCNINWVSAQRDSCKTSDYYIIGQINETIAIRLPFNVFLKEVKEENFDDGSYESCKKILEELTHTHVHHLLVPISTRAGEHPAASQLLLSSDEWDVFACFDDLLPRLFKQRKIEMYHGKENRFILDYEVKDEHGVVSVFLPDGERVYNMTWCIYD